jgi:hypothetical protein
MSLSRSNRLELMPSQIGIFVNGCSVRLNRTPNVTMLQTYTPTAELSDTGDFAAEFREQKHEPLNETRHGSIQSPEKSLNCSYSSSRD